MIDLTRLIIPILVFIVGLMLELLGLIMDYCGGDGKDHTYMWLFGSFVMGVGVAMFFV